MKRPLIATLMSIRHLIAASMLALLFGGICVTEANTPKDFFQNSDLTDPANYSPPGTPSVSDDVVLTSSAPVLTLNAASLTMGTLNRRSISTGRLPIRLLRRPTAHSRSSAAKTAQLELIPPTRSTWHAPRAASPCKARMAATGLAFSKSAPDRLSISTSLKQVRL